MAADQIVAAAGQITSFGIEEESAEAAVVWAAATGFAEVVARVVKMKIQSMVELEGWYAFSLDLTGQSLRLAAINYAYLYC